MKHLATPRFEKQNAFAVSEILLTVTTATTVIGTILTALSIYISVADDRRSVATSRGVAAVLPAHELSMDASLFHLELQDIVHQADLVYVIGGNRYVPGSPSHANFVFEPSLDLGELPNMKIIEGLEAFPNRALSSYVITRMIQSELPDAFVESEEALYRKHEFTIIAAKTNLDVIALVSFRVTTQTPWIVLESSVKRSNKGTWSQGNEYRCAVEKSVFDAKASLLSIGATHYWLHHDRLDPQANEISTNSVWNRYEEGVCTVEFPDPLWNLALHEGGLALPSKYRYFLSVAR